MWRGLLQSRIRCDLPIEIGIVVHQRQLGKIDDPMVAGFALFVSGRPRVVAPQDAPLAVACFADVVVAIEECVDLRPLQNPSQLFAVFELMAKPRVEGVMMDQTLTTTS